MDSETSHQPHAPLWRRALEAANAAPRCGARTRFGGSCLGPAMANGRCRMHGGTSPGAPKGPGNGNYMSGLYTQEAKAERQMFRRLLREAKARLKTP